ncbi:MAG TPA: hypothetical protein VG605_17495 [Puia sp.]|jgi:hypothetical protein|nr:hypothetical protein [Puia sp.]
MADLNSLTGEETILEEPRKLPEMLNVLTILTFIGSAIGILINCYYLAAAKRIYDASMANQEKIESAPAIIRNMQGPDPIGVIQRTFDNRIPIAILGIVATVLCIIGAVQMRKLKKTGFYIYLIGEVLPIIVTYIFIGSAALSGLRLIFSVLFIAIFIILYATQLKYLKK